MSKKAKPRTPREVADQYVSTVQVPTLDGPKEYIFKLLKRRVAAEVHYRSLNTLVQSVFGLLGDKGQKLSPQSLAAVSNVLLDFDNLWDLGGKLLTEAHIGGVKVDFEEYFGENPDELIVAVFYGIQANYPRVFSKVRARIAGFNLSGLIEKKLKENPKYDTPLVRELLKTFRSQDSTTQTPKK